MRWCLVALLLVSGTVHAQEMKCPQVFMNSSEKEVCANAQLLALDRAMGTAYRAAAPHVDKIERDHRAFKKDRKACKGDVACLTALYEARIGVLALAVPAPVEAQPPEEIPVPFPMPERDTGAVPQPAAPAYLDSTAVEPPPQMAPAVSPVAPTTSSEPSKDGWGLLLVWGLLIVAAIAKLFSWVARFIRRCPKCTRWWGEEFDRDEQPRTRFMKVHDGHGVKNKRIQEVWRKSRLRCAGCGHEWFMTSTHRVW